MNPKKPKLRPKRPKRDYKHEYQMRRLLKSSRKIFEQNSASMAFNAGVALVMSQNKIRLAHIYIEQAEVARQQSDLEGSIAGYTRAINIYKDMAQEEPACWELVADTIERAAATYKAAGDLDKAKEALAEAATLRETLSKLEAQAAVTEEF